MNVMQINATAGWRYIARARVPVGATLEDPTAAGQITGIRMRISDNRPRLVAGVMEGGEALDTALDNLAATEVTEDPGQFYVDISQALHEEHILPLGRGARFYAIWEQPGVSKNQIDTFVVATGSDI